MCERQYDMTAVAALQQAAANVEAEQRRLYRAELAQELRNLLQSRLALFRQLPVTNFDYVAGVTFALIVLDELAPTVTCDNPAN